MLDIFKRGGAIPTAMTFSLTEMGKAKAEEYTGDPRSRILMALDSNGASNCDEISRVAHIPKGLVERQIPQLIRAGYVQSTRTMG